MVGQSPNNFDLAQSRWTLKALRQKIEAFKHYSISGLWHVLKNIGVRHLRARQYVHSPDPAYQAKVEYLINQIRTHQADQEEIYFMDQLTVYLHPSVGYEWTPAAKKQPLSVQGHHANKTFRICGALNGLTGQTHVLIRNRITVPSLIHFFEELSLKHPQKNIWVVLDNWPVHCHPDILAALAPQRYPFPLILPKSWTKLKPKAKFSGKNLPIQLLFLPTYASWLNPIEKLWRWLKQDLLHNHLFTDQWDALKSKVIEWLDHPSHKAQPLLQYVGLKAPDAPFTIAFLEAITNMSKNV